MTKQMTVQALTTRRSAQKEQRRQELIAATMDTIADRGLAGATLAEVTPRADLSLGLANHHFGSLENLLTASLRHPSEELRAVWAEHQTDRDRFTSDLPAATQQAIADLPMGLLEKVGLMFDGARFGLSGSVILTQLYDGPVPAPACHFLTFPTGHDYVVDFVGGNFGWEIAAEGAGIVIDFTLAEFVSAVGSDARRHFLRGHFSGWSQNPLTIGAYSAVCLGRHAARAALASPVDDRFFCRRHSGGRSYRPDVRRTSQRRADRQKFDPKARRWSDLC